MNVNTAVTVSALESVPDAPLHTYHGSCMSERPSGQRTGTRSGADAVRVAYADSWPGHNGRRDATGCWFDSLLRGLGQGLLTIQQRKPQGREALLLTGRERPEFIVIEQNRHAWETTIRSCKNKCCCGHWLVWYYVITKVWLKKYLLTCDNTCLCIFDSCGFIHCKKKKNFYIEILSFDFGLIYL